MLQKLEKALVQGPLEAQWNESLDSWDASPEQRAEILSWVTELRDNFMASARDIEDAYELELTSAIEYIELKSHWLRLNTQMNYQLFKKGIVDEAVQYRGTVVSQLLASIEPLLKEEDIITISTFLNEPINDTY